MKPRLRPPTEKVVQRLVVKMFEAFDCTVYNLSQPRHTMQTPGLPDLIVFAPGDTALCFFEVKRPGAKQRSEQLEFDRRCFMAAANYRWGGVDEAKRLLRDWGLTK